MVANLRYWMLELADNLYNQTQSPEMPKFKLWNSMGMLLTYKCPASCSFCYYRCNPNKGGLLSLENALSAWQSLIKIAGSSAKIHITGGEPFLYWSHLSSILSEAKKLGLGTVDVIETNAFWATDKADVVEKLKFLDSHNVKKIKISYDPFHAEFVDYSKVKLLADTGAEILGKDRVLVRWQEYMAADLNVMNMSEEEKISLFIDSIKKFPCRFNGQAARGRLSEAFESKDIDEIAKSNCRNSFLSSKGIHLDPYGNVFSGTCSGIIIGNIEKQPLDEIWQNFEPSKMDVINVLLNKGPTGLLEKATNHGYQKRRLYSGKCHLCTDLRQFFFDKGIYGPIIGPKDCYN
ncbi:MAG: radical SAM protein [Phycisphaerales bacterium]